MPTSKKAVCLLSGGLDSSTCLALARREGYACYALSFDYGQRHKVELEAAARVAAAFGAERHLVAKIGLDAFGGSALTADIAVPKARSAAEMSHGIPITYVPARNTIFLSFALAWAEVLESADIFIGVNALDYSGYPDCRPEYIEAYRANGQPGNESRRGRAHAAQNPHAAAPLQQGADRHPGARAWRAFRADSQLLRSRRRTDARAASAMPACCGARASRRRA